MTMDADTIADRIEKYLREQFSIADDDPGFTRRSTSTRVGTSTL